MQIISIYYTHKPGGFCVRLYRLLNALAQRGHRVCYLSLDAPPSALDSAIEFVQIPFPLKQRQGVLFWCLFMAFSPWVFAWYAHKKAAERIVVFGAIYACLALLAQIVTGARLVLFVRSLVFKINRITRKPEMLCWLSDGCEQLGLFAADRVVAMSRTMATELKKFSWSKPRLAILPNDVPTAPAKTGALPALEPLEALKASGRQLVVVSGVFDRRKNLPLVLDAMKIVNRDIPEHKLTLVVAGEGPDLELAREYARQVKDSSIYLTGWLPGLTELYTLASLVIHPSLHEGMPNSVLEAWAKGIPTLLADTDELREMAPEENLWFSTTEGTSLPTRLKAIANNPGELDHLRKLTEQCAKTLRFNWDQQAVDLTISA